MVYIGYAVYATRTGGSYENVETCLMWDMLTEKDFENAQNKILNNCQRLKTPYNTMIDECEPTGSNGVKVLRYCKIKEVHEYYTPPKGFPQKIVDGGE